MVGEININVLFVYGVVGGVHISCYLLISLFCFPYYIVKLKLDWLRAQFILRKLLTNGEAKSVVVKEVELRKRSEILRWLAVVKALLDTVLSMAASVISSLLLMSGDVEENPGPGPGGRNR